MTLETKIAKIESAVKELVTQQEKINNVHAETLAAIHMANAIMIKGEN